MLCVGRCVAGVVYVMFCFHKRVVPPLKNGAFALLYVLRSRGAYNKRNAAGVRLIMFARFVTPIYVKQGHG